MVTQPTQDELQGHAGPQYEILDEPEVPAPLATNKGTLVPLNYEATRLPYDDRLERDYHIAFGDWVTLCDSVFPGINNPNSILMALRYCAARKLDIFKRPISIVPMWRKLPGENRGMMVDTIWPGIQEIFTTAIRTGQWGGNDAAEWCEDLRMTFQHKETKAGKNNITILHLVLPRWCRYTVRRIVDKKERNFVGPQVHWLETYAQQSRWSEIPNAMWEKRPRGQLDKCGKAASLRAAFPEELPSGGYIGDEMEGKEITTEVADIQQLSEEDTNRTLERQSLEVRGSKSIGWTQDTGMAPAATAETSGPAAVSGEHPQPGHTSHAKPPSGSASPGVPGPVAGAPKPPPARGAAPADDGPPRPPPRRASTPAPTSAAESSSPTKPATPTAQTAEPSSPAQTTAVKAPPTTGAPFAGQDPAASSKNGAPRPPKLCGSTSIPATAKADAAVSGSVSPSTDDIRQSWLSSRPNFAGPIEPVLDWIKRLFEMAPEVENIGEYFTDYVEPHMDAIFPHDRDAIYELMKAEEKKRET